MGVFKLVDPSPVKVIMRALPMPPRKVTELVPLPLHPAQVKVPDVENVTGSALASDIPSDTIARSNALMRDVLKTPFMVAPLCFASMYVRTYPKGNDNRSLAMGTQLSADAVTAAGQARTVTTCLR